jgi:CubicO group peptidase (beta-lactamase class C family)
MKSISLFRPSLPLAALVASTVLLSLAGGAASAQQAGSSEPDLTAIDRFVESERQATRVPGVAIGIIQGDRIIHLAGFGQADPTGRPVTPQTPMIGASITKSFTALAVMQLVEAGKVDLDAPIQRYLSWFRVADADASARITVRHLLNQTSGFPTFEANAGMIGGDMDEQALERRVRSFASMSLSQPVGSTYQYSNFNYMTLGMLVQVVSGESYEQYLQKYVLDPLDMRRSFTSQAAAGGQGLATGYRFWFGTPVATDLTYSRAIRPAGGLVSTSEDLAHYLVAQLNGGRYGSTSVLSPAGIAEQHRGAARIENTDAYYGMGWQTGAIDGIPIVQHDGMLITGYADMVLLPEHELAIVVLANGASRVTQPRLGGIAAGIANVLVGRPAIPATENRLFQVLTILSFAIIGVQAFGIFLTTMRLRRWRRQLERRPAGALSLAWHLGLPLALNLGWGAAVLLGLPLLFGLTLADSVFIVGDFAYLIAGSAAVALVWGLLRTLLAWRALNLTTSAIASGSPKASAAVSLGHA